MSYRLVRVKVRVRVRVRVKVKVGVRARVRVEVRVRVRVRVRPWAVQRWKTRLTHGTDSGFAVVSSWTWFT